MAFATSVSPEPHSPKTVRSMPRMASMIEEKFGEGSEEHIQALQAPGKNRKRTSGYLRVPGRKELSAACLAAEKPSLAATLYVTLSRRFFCSVIPCHSTSSDSKRLE